MIKNASKIGGILSAALFLLLTSDSLPKEIPYKILSIEKISRYHEDRIAFQHIQFDAPENTLSQTDNSIATLLIITDKKMYLLKDGYDNPAIVRKKANMFQTERRLTQNEEVWTNRIDSKPDFIRITERRIQILRKIDAAAERSDEEKKSETRNTATGEKNFVLKNFEKLYLNVRNEFLKKHVKIFRQLMANRSKSGLYVERTAIPKEIFVGDYNPPTKYSIIAKAKTLDEKIYYAEDADGDGITETFSVHIPDGFIWGHKSGPNIIFIYKNKEKDIESIIGTLTNDAYYGTDEEAKTIKENMKDRFPKEDDPQKVREWINRLVPTIED